LFHYFQKDFEMVYIIIALFCIVLALSPVWSAQSPPPPLMLAKTANLYSLDNKPNAYIVSEKFDGVRAIWTGKKFISRQGNLINAPDWFTAPLPTTVLEGELWLRRNAFSELNSIVSKHEPIDSEWQQVQFMVFDLPSSRLPFNERVMTIERIASELNTHHIKAIEHHQFDDFKSLEVYFKQVIENGGEGVMLNLANANYTQGRQSALLKLKPYYDAEATVIDHIEGKGKFEDMLGALLVKNAQGQKFKVGTGFSEAERQNPPKRGDVITYKYFGYTRTGLPRFASFLRINNQK
jgi:DNA ligase-1